MLNLCVWQKGFGESDEVIEEEGIPALDEVVDQTKLSQADFLSISA